MKTNYRCLRPQRLWNTKNLVIYNLLPRTCRHPSWRHLFFVWMKYQMSRMKNRKGGERRGWGSYSPVQGRNTTQVTIIFEINAKQRREKVGKNKYKAYPLPAWGSWYWTGMSRSANRRAATPARRRWPPRWTASSSGRWTEQNRRLLENNNNNNCRHGRVWMRVNEFKSTDN